MKHSAFTPHLPTAVLHILETLQGAGYEAYIVGGCVRDMILAQSTHTPYVANDYDITTSALPQEIMRLFAHTISTGLKYGTISVLIESQSYEVTTFRIDGVYSNARSPKNVTFTRSLVQDLQRRDFTINALAYAPQCGLIDEVGGLRDLYHKRIVCVGNPLSRLSEDALRILRALRFSATLGFEIESNTKAAIFSLCPKVRLIAKERIKVELTKLLCGAWAKAVLQEFKSVIGEICPQMREIITHNTLWQRTLCILDNLTSPNPTLAWGAFLYYTDELQVRDILKSLKFDTHSKEYTYSLLEWAKKPLKNNPIALKSMLVDMGGREKGVVMFKDVLKLKTALINAQDSEDKAQENEMLERISSLVAHILASSTPLERKELCLNGRDLIHIGVSEGKRVGEILHLLHQEVLHERVSNTKQALLSKAQEILESKKCELEPKD
ncbi:CCA tRNA nucleotidyltransferase [Helicobacter sp. MIT 21-1697]|uniref:CCA tRNA nucleotidyltransferase n=1 Tax=Helicobacter sp. MIT 21-1697 TaxID=2993733 RepID=UPI00224ACDD9|nr:CCA tRNA nucleotidyltransferase [Helicobacter sp. MIT 21-1697]MCX2716743.1 CCA tRNA nucleotidyltransferase [Helicobacter sp. MIT 21-1697]